MYMYSYRLTSGDELFALVFGSSLDTLLAGLPGRYNCALRQAESTVFEAAKRHNTGVVIMNASARGGAAESVANLSTAEGSPAEELFYRYVLSHPQVSASVMGMRDIDRFRTVVVALSEKDTLTAEEKTVMEEHGAAMVAATVAAQAEARL